MIAVAFLLVASACSSAGTANPPETESSGLNGEFEALDGTTIDLAEFQGQDVVLWFWAPW